MKKLLVMAAMLFAVVSLAACNRLDPMELLERSHEAQAEANINSMTMEIEGQIDMTMERMSMNMPLTMHLEMESKERMSIETNMSMMGEESNTTMFLRDGYEYSETSDLSSQPQRTRLAADTSSSAEIIEMIEGMLSEDFFSTADTSSAATTDDGYRLAFTYNIEDILSYLGDTMKAMPGMEEFGNMDDLLDFDEEDLGEWDIEMVMYLDEDYLPISSTITLEGELAVSQMEMDLTLAFTITMSVEEVTIDFPDWLDEMDVLFDESELLGYWENGSGPILLFIFGSADSVEFSENGIVTITEDGNSRTANWSPDGEGAFVADEVSFTYSIDGDMLTITDNVDDHWSFYREGATPEVDEDEEDEDTEDEDIENDEDEEGEEATEVSREFRNALSSGRNYLRFMSFSFESLSSQLDFEGYSSEAIAWAMEQIDADTDWYEQAVGSAESYLDSMSFSPSSLVDQLVFEGFTQSQAQHAVDIVFE